MAPASHLRADVIAGFVDFHRNAARHEMRGRRQSDRTGADHGDRQLRICLSAHADTFAFFFAGAGLHAAGAQASATPWQQFSVR